MGASAQVRGHTAVVETWQKRTEIPLIAVALLFLVAYGWPILDTELSPGWRSACDVATWVAWAVFALDFVVRFGLAEGKRAFLRANVLDLLVIALPLLRPLRLLRLVTLVRVFNRGAETTLRGRLGVYVGGAALLLGSVAALAVLDAERADPSANIHGYGDALWWTATTMTTVGYGDRYPVTDTGRVIAVALMISGIAVLGVVTATLASWISDRVRAETQATDALAEEIRELRLLLQDRGAARSEEGV